MNTVSTLKRVLNPVLVGRSEISHVPNNVESYAKCCISYWFLQFTASTLKLPINVACIFISGLLKLIRLQSHKIQYPEFKFPRRKMKIILQKFVESYFKIFILISALSLYFYFFFIYFIHLFFIFYFEQFFLKIFL